jgi:hypothetical protein
MFAKSFTLKRWPHLASVLGLTTLIITSSVFWNNAQSKEESEFWDSMKEPVLSELKDKDLEIYRLLREGGLGQYSLSVRIEKRAEDIAMAVKQLGYDPESKTIALKVSKTIPLDLAKWNEFVVLITKAGFWDLLTKKKPTSGCRDCSRIVMEGVKKGNYHIVRRWGIEGELYFRKASSYLLEISGLLPPGPPTSCPSGYVLNMTFGECRPHDSERELDSSCPPGYVENMSTGECEPN